MALLKGQGTNTLIFIPLYKYSELPTSTHGTDIANEMKTTLCGRLKSFTPHVAVILDKSTLYKTSVIAIYLRTRSTDLNEVCRGKLQSNRRVKV